MPIMQVVSFALKTGAYVVRGNHDDGALQAAIKASSSYRLKQSWVKDLSPEEVTIPPHMLDTLSVYW